MTATGKSSLDKERELFQTFCRAFETKFEASKESHKRYVSFDHVGQMGWDRFVHAAVHVACLLYTSPSPRDS